jgi:hypothetical protein
MNAPADEVDPLAQLLEGLLNDPDARARFRREPALVCRELGLDDAAEELSGGAKALHTLELRESKSSLAGLLVAAAAEGVGLADLVHHVYEHLNGDTARLAGQALTRAGMPAVHQAVTRAGLPAVQPLEPAVGGALGPEQLSGSSLLRPNSRRRPRRPRRCSRALSSASRRPLAPVSSREGRIRA